MSTKRYDTKCEELVRHFLSDAGMLDTGLSSLAGTIQAAVDDWFVGRDSPCGHNICDQCGKLECDPSCNTDNRIDETLASPHIKRQPLMPIGNRSVYER